MSPHKIIIQLQIELEILRAFQVYCSNKDLAMRCKFGFVIIICLVTPGGGCCRGTTDEALTIIQPSVALCNLGKG